jgi:hypothetical protein
MRRLSRFLVVTGLAATAVVTTTATANADVLPAAICTRGEPVCLEVPGTDVPVGNPVTVPYTEQPVTPVPVYGHCDPVTGECVDVYVVVPGGSVESTGGSVLVLHIPDFAVGIGGSPLVTTYGSVPTTSPGTGSLGITASVATDLVPVVVTLGERECSDQVPITVGPAAITQTGCVTRITVTL